MCFISHFIFNMQIYTHAHHRYFVLLALSTIILSNPYSIPPSTIHRIYQHMCEFCHNAVDADLIALAEHKSKLYYWITFKPCVQLLYAPTTPSTAYDYSSKEVKKYFQFCPENQSSENYANLLPELQHMAIRTVLCSLLLDLSDRSSGCVIMRNMMQDKLIPFIIILPFYVPRSLLREAQMVVQCLKNYVPIKPLSLVDLAKAALAKIYCGLYKVLRSEDYIYSLKCFYHKQQTQRKQH